MVDDPEDLMSGNSDFYKPSEKEKTELRCILSSRLRKVLWAGDLQKPLKETFI